jgi:hypothetical protein
MPESATTCLRQLESARHRYGVEVAFRKSGLLAVLEKASLARASEVLRLHEALCFMRAYPDHRSLLMRVERMLRGFSRRGDLRRHRAALADTGIAGTAIHFRFFAPTAAWLAKRHPRLLHVDWKKFSRSDRLESFLPLLVHYAETPGLDEWDLEVREWVRRLKGRGESDGAFLARRFDALKADTFARERIYDDLDIPMRLDPGPGTPSRTLSRHAASPVVFVRSGIPRERPVLPTDALRPPLAVRELSLRRANAVIDLAREAMVTRQRDRILIKLTGWSRIGFLNEVFPDAETTRWPSGVTAHVYTEPVRSSMVASREPASSRSRTGSSSAHPNPRRT